MIRRRPVRWFRAHWRWIGSPSRYRGDPQPSVGESFEFGEVPMHRGASADARTGRSGSYVVTLGGCPTRSPSTSHTLGSAGSAGSVGERPVSAAASRPNVPLRGTSRCRWRPAVRRRPGAGRCRRDGVHRPGRAEREGGKWPQPLHRHLTREPERAAYVEPVNHVPHGADTVVEPRPTLRFECLAMVIWTLAMYWRSRSVPGSRSRTGR